MPKPSINLQWETRLPNGEIDFGVIARSEPLQSLVGSAPQRHIEVVPSEDPGYAYVAVVDMEVFVVTTFRRPVRIDAISSSLSFLGVDPDTVKWTLRPCLILADCPPFCGGK